MTKCVLLVTSEEGCLFKGNRKCVLEDTSSLVTMGGFKAAIWSALAITEASDAYNFEVWDADFGEFVIADGVESFGAKAKIRIAHAGALLFVPGLRPCAAVC
jgi:hypothetical protein